MFYIEVLNDRDEVLYKIEELKKENYFEEDLHLLLSDEEFTAIEYTEVNRHYYNEEKGVFDYFSAQADAVEFLSSTDVETSEVKQYINYLKEGKFLIYYDDHTIRHRHSSYDRDSNDFE